MIQKFRPNGDRILVKRRSEEEKTVSGIIIPDNAKEKPQLGEVIAVGEGKLNSDGKRVIPAVKIGQIVYFGKYAGTEIELGDDLLIIREDEILGFVEK